MTQQWIIESLEKNDRETNRLEYIVQSSFTVVIKTNMLPYKNTFFLSCFLQFLRSSLLNTSFLLPLVQAVDNFFL